MAAVPEGARSHDRGVGGVAVFAAAGGGPVGGERYDAIFHPAAHRLLERVDAVLRLPGASTGADEDVRRARARGIPVYFDLDEVPEAA